MKTVSQSEFYAKMNLLDVHPCPRKVEGVWISEWKLRSGEIVGKTTNDYTGKTVKYELS